MFIWRVIVISVPSQWRMYNVIRDNSTIWRIEWKIKSYPLTCPWKRYRKNNGRRTVTRRVITFARNHSRSDDTRVRDHCHFTGQYCGPAHANCNLNYKNSFYIPIIFHNLSNYDAHFVIKEIAIAYGGRIWRCVTDNQQKIYFVHKYV